MPPASGEQYERITLEKYQQVSQKHSKQQPLIKSNIKCAAVMKRMMHKTCFLMLHKSLFKRQG